MIRKFVFVVVIVLLLSGCSSVKEDKTAANTNSSTNAQNQANESLNNNIESINEKVGNAVIPDHGQILEAFIPEGWAVMTSVEGDLNEDSLPDIAAVIEKKVDKESLFPRILLVLFQEKDKSYTVSVKTDTAILRANEGGVWGDPFESISVDRGSILLNFYGGSNWRWYGKYRFRFQDDEWYLIGATLGSYFTGTTTEDNSDEEDHNLLTGDYIEKKVDDNGNIKVTKVNRGKRELIKLKDFIVNSEEKQF